MDHVYGVKFFTKQMLNSVKKYSHLTNTYEPRTILYSVFKLMLDIYAKDKQASFMFIGNADENGNHENTRRYRLFVISYQTLSATNISSIYAQANIVFTFLPID